MRCLYVAGVLWLAGCGGTLRDGYFQKDSLKYRVAVPAEPEWKRVDFADNDLAWVRSSSGHLLAINATCDGHGDPSLEVLTQHLIFGFSDRVTTGRTQEMVNGREALRTKMTAKLDGVPVELELLVLKKNGCVHDLSLVSPVGRSGEAQAAFDALQHQFTAETR